MGLSQAQPKEETTPPSFRPITPTGHHRATSVAHLFATGDSTQLVASWLYNVYVILLLNRRPLETMSVFVVECHIYIYIILARLM